jgi:hypothetical protein
MTTGMHGPVMNKLKTCLIAVAAVAGFSLPAIAGPIAVNVSNVQVNWGQGQGLTIQAGANPMGIYYAGPIIFTINGANAPLIVWCDDLYNDVYIGSSDQYYKVSAASYLAPLALSTVKDIAGLAFQGTQEALANTLSSARGAEFQLAIWELEYGNIHDIADAGIQTGVDSLIGAAPLFFADMNSTGWSYSELDSPGCGQQPDGINYTNGCQTQGQMYVYPNNRVPEPVTLSLFGAGVAGAIGLRWRKKARQA